MPPGDEPQPDTTGYSLTILALSLGVAVASVLVASVVRVIVDDGRTLRQLRTEMGSRD